MPLLDGKQPAFIGKNQQRFIRLRSLGEGYSKEEIQAVISGKNLHKSKGGSAKAPAPKQFQMLIDIQAKMAEGKTVGYEKRAKKFNRKEAARTVFLLKMICQIKCNTYDELPSNSSLGVLYFMHLRGLLFIKFRFFFSSSGSTSDRSIPLG